MSAELERLQSLHDRISKSLDWLEQFKDAHRWSPDEVRKLLQIRWLLLDIKAGPPRVGAEPLADQPVPVKPFKQWHNSKYAGQGVGGIGPFRVVLRTDRKTDQTFIELLHDDDAGGYGFTKRQAREIIPLLQQAVDQLSAPPGAASPRVPDEKYSADQLIADVLAEYAEECVAGSCDHCADCGKLVLCRFHSVLSVLQGRTWTNARIERDTRARVGAEPSPYPEEAANALGHPYTRGPVTFDRAASHRPPPLADKEK